MVYNCAFCSEDVIVGLVFNKGKEVGYAKLACGNCFIKHKNDKI